VYKIKRTPEGQIDRYKARLMAKGFDQQYGIDYFETFSPVIKPSTIRVVLSLAVAFNWPIKQLDVSNAFLHGFLDEEVYMEQPQGFIDESRPEYICRLHKSLYGLKQAPRAWFQRFSTHLLDIGFQESSVDHSLFTLQQAKSKLFVLVYVDDIIITGTQDSEIEDFIKQL
jgi:hypothetical protein